MKKLYFIVVAVVASLQVDAQLLKLNSKDSLENKPVKQLYITAWLKFSGFVDSQGT